VQWNNYRNNFLVKKKDRRYTFFYKNKVYKKLGFRGPKVLKILRLCDKFCQKYFYFKKNIAAKTSFWKLWKNITGRVKSFMIFYLRFFQFTV